MDAKPAESQEAPAPTAVPPAAEPAAEPTDASKAEPTAAPVPVLQVTHTPAPAPQEQQQQQQQQQPLTLHDHIAMADRLSLVSWGEGSVPSMPAADDSASDRDFEVSTINSTTTSVRSTIYNYVEENGRTYHRYKEGQYPLPNDLQEQERLDLQHAIFVLTTHGKSFLAPTTDPKRVLDIATGTGIWAIEFALQFPDAQVIGTDLSPIQPEYIPGNCRFEIDDAEDDWPFKQPFDYIHGRALVSCFRDPRSVIARAFEHCAPGGYLELQDGVMPFEFAPGTPPNCHLERWVNLVVQAAARTGRPWTNTQHYSRWMKEIGFEDVVERRFYWPFNAWPRGAYYKTLGAYAQADLLNGFEGLSLKLLGGVLGMQLDEIHELIALARADLLDTRVRSYVQMRIVWGRKPGGKAAAAAAATAATTTATTTTTTTATAAADVDVATTTTTTTTATDVDAATSEQTTAEPAATSAKTS